MPNRIHACAETNQRYSLYFHFQLTLVFRRKLDSLLHIIKLHKMNKHEKKPLALHEALGAAEKHVMMVQNTMMVLPMPHGVLRVFFHKIQR